MKRIALILSALLLSAVPVAAQEPDPVAVARQQADQAEATAQAAQSRASQAQAEANAALARASQAASQARAAQQTAEQARLNATLAEAQAAVDKAAQAQRQYEQALSDATIAVERANAALAEANTAIQAYEQARQNWESAITSAQERASAAEGNLDTMSAVLDGEREQVAWLRIALVFVSAVGVAGLAFVGLLYTRQVKPVTIVEHHHHGERAEQDMPEPARRPFGSAQGRPLGVTIVGGPVAQEAIDRLDVISQMEN